MVGVVVYEGQLEGCCNKCPHFPPSSCAYLRHSRSCVFDLGVARPLVFFTLPSICASHAQLMYVLRKMQLHEEMFLPRLQPGLQS